MSRSIYAPPGPVCDLGHHDRITASGVASRASMSLRTPPQTPLTRHYAQKRGLVARPSRRCCRRRSTPATGGRAPCPPSRHRGAVHRPPQGSGGERTGGRVDYPMAVSTSSAPTCWMTPGGSARRSMPMPAPLPAWHHCTRRIRTPRSGSPRRAAARPPKPYEADFADGIWWIVQPALPAGAAASPPRRDPL